MMSGSSRSLKRRVTASPPRLNLTPMVDVFVVLLIFLLKSYSTEGSIQISDPDLHLPTSISTQQPELTLTITVTQEAIYVEDKKVGTVAASQTLQDRLIPALAQELQFHAKRTQFIGSFNPDVEPQGKVTILGDRKLPFSVLEKVMYTCSIQGFQEIALAVLQK